MSEQSHEKRKAQWRPKPKEEAVSLIAVYRKKHFGQTVDELKVSNPRLLRLIRDAGEEYMIAGQGPLEYQNLAYAYTAAFTNPGGVRKRIFRSRRFGKELMQWLLETYPGGLPSPEKVRMGGPDERQFYNDLKYAHLSRYLNKFKGLRGADPLESYQALCNSEGRILTRGQLLSLKHKGGKAIYRALERAGDPENPTQSLLQKHVPTQKQLKGFGSAPTPSSRQE